MADTLSNKVEVQRPNGTWVDITDYVASARVKLGDVQNVGTKNGADGVAKTLDLEVQNDDDNSFAPRDRDSDWNKQSGTYAPLLWANRRVKVMTNDIVLFEGFINSATKTTRHTVNTKATDLSYPLRYTHIENVEEYGSEGGTPAEDVIQNIMNDHLENPPTLYVQDSPGFAVQPYEVELYNSVWDAVNDVVNQFGYYLGYRYIDSLGEFRLTLLEPPRTKDVENYDWMLTSENDYIKNDLDVSASDIRNVVDVVYTDPDATLEEGFRSYAGVKNQDSIDEYGRRAMLIEKSDTSLIDTDAEALNLAQAALKDLYAPSATSKIEMPYFPEIQLFDGIAIDDPEISSTIDFYGVESVEHDLNFENQKFRTTITGGQEIVGGRKRWLEMDARKGIKNPTTGEEISSSITTPTPVNFTFVESELESIRKDVTAYAKFSWDKPQGNKDIQSYVLQIKKDSNTTWNNAETKIVEATEPNMTTKVILPPAETYDARIATLTSIGLMSRWVGIITFTTAKNETKPDPPQDLNAYGTQRGLEVNFLPNTETDIDYYKVYVDTSAGFTPDNTNLKAHGFSTYFHFTNLTPLTEYYVKATAINTSGTESDPSNEDNDFANFVDWDDIGGTNKPEDDATSNKTFYQSTAPSGEGESAGDIWIDSDNGTPYVYEDASWNRTSWADVGSDPNAPVDNATRNDLIRQSTEPDPDDYSEGDMWVDSDNGTPYLHDGNDWQRTTWESISDDVNVPNTSSTIVVAAYNSSNRGINNADYVCDGVNDESEINQALSSISGNGGTVILLEGTFVIEDTLHLYSNTDLKGQGKNTIIKLDGNTTSYIRMIANENISGGNENITVADLQIDGNKSSISTTNEQHGIFMENCDDVQIHNVKVTNMNNAAIAFEGTTNSTINNSLTSYNDTGAIFVFGGSDNNSISNNISKYNTLNGILVRDEGNNVIGNVCKENSSDGIVLSQGEKTALNNNTCNYNGHRGIYISDNADNCSVTGNDCFSNSQSSDLSYDNIRIESTCDNNNVQNNTCRAGTEINQPAYGISIDSNADNNFVTNNDLYNGGATGSIDDNSSTTVTTAGNRT